MKSSPNTILIIEDDEIVRLNTSDYLLDEGFDVLAAEDGLEGVRLATENSPDMIICDIAMPKLDGYEVYDRIKNNQDTKYIPFIFLTAKVDTPDVLKGIKLGVDDYITKPFNLEKLTAIINNKLKKNKEISIAAELKSRAYIETSDNPVFIYRDNRLVYLNPKFVKEFRLSEKDINDIYINDIFNEKDCETLIAEINKCLNFKSKNFKIGCTANIKYGEKKHFDIFGSLGEFEGSPAVQCNLYDISDTKDILGKINEIEKDYTDLLQMLPIGICKMDVYGKIIYSNSSLSKLTGYSPDELNGKFLWEVIGNPDDNTLIMEMLKKLREEYSKPFSIFSENFTKSGKKYKSELQWDYIRDSNHINIGFLCLFIDITERETAKLAFEESEKKFLGIAEVVSDWIWEIDKDGYYTFASPKVFDILGYTPDEIIGKKPTHMLKHDEIPKVTAFIQKIFKEKNHFKNFRNICLHKNGSEVILESSGIPLFEDDGEFKGFYGIDRNITEIIYTEKELTEAQERLNLLLKYNPDIAIYEFESKNEFISENLNTILGYNNSKLKTKDNFYNIIHPDDIVELKNIRDNWFHSKSKNSLVTEYRLLDKSGNYIWFQDKMNIISNESGEYYIIGLLINIHERKKKDIEIDIIISAMDKFPVMIMIIDSTNKIIFANKFFATQTGISSDSVTGKSFFSVFTDEDVETINELLDFTGTKTRNKNSVSITGKNGEIIIKHIQVIPVFSNRKEINASLVILSDLKNKNNSESELRQSISKAEEFNRIKSVLLRSLSHEFRTPMNSIIGYTEILKEKIPDNNHRKMIKGIEVSAEKLHKTLSTIFKLTQIEILNNTIKNTVFNLSKELRRIFESFIERFKDKKLKYDIQISDKELLIYANYSFLEQSVSNIIDNAIKFTYEGIITLKIETFENDNEKFALISINDTGMGIPPEKLDYVFKDADNSGSRFSSHFEGAGFGLTLSKMMIEIMNGSIKVDSVYDVGTTVTIVFPLISNQ